VLLRANRVVHLEGGFVRPDGTEEVYPRFTGKIDRIEIADDRQTARLICRSIEAMTTEVFDENLPDRLAYHANGYVLRQPLGEPVFGVPTFDAWPLELAIQECCYRSGIDPVLLGYEPGVVRGTSVWGRQRLRA